MKHWMQRQEPEATFTSRVAYSDAADEILIRAEGRCNRSRFNSDSASDAIEEERYSCPTSRRQLAIRTVAKVAERYRPNNIAVAAVYSAFVRDVGHADVIVDRSIVRCEKRASVQLEASHMQLPTLLYFDGRKNRTCESGITSTTEEHIVVVEDPDSIYLDHVQRRTQKNISGGQKMSKAISVA